MAETATKTDDIQGTTILTQKELEKPAAEKQLFQSEQDKTNAIADARAKAIAELETKAATEKVVADKILADKSDADAAAKTETDKTKTDGKTADASKKDDASKSVEYTLTLPENSPLTKEDLDGLLKEAKESGLSADEAKELMNQTDQVARTAQSRLIKTQEEQLKTMVTQWKDAVKKDPEMGGDHLAETAVKASRAFKAVASREMQVFCEKTGYADHPELVRMMVKIYDLIGEDKFVKGSTGIVNTTATTLEEKAKRLFGTPIKEAVV